MKWINASKEFPSDWEYKHWRYSKDRYKLDTDLFNVEHLRLVKKGGSGFVLFSEIEWLDETIEEKDWDLIQSQIADILFDCNGTSAGASDIIDYLKCQ